MVKVLNRDKIQRMVDYTGGAGTQSSSGGGGEGVSQAWVNANFVSIAYFEQLFKAYKPAEQTGDPDVEVKPNTIDEDITNIKAMKGFWTEQFISALGQGSGGGGGGGASALTDLVDVSISSPSSGQVLMYDGNGHWINGSISMSGYATQAWVQQQGYATQNWVGQNYLGLHATADAAAKLTTVNKTAWGQTYWTSGGVPTSIDGDMSSVGDISFKASGKNIGGIAYFDTTNGRLGIGAAPGAYKLDVTGKSHFSDDIHIGAASAGASPCIYWGDGSYVYIGELSDDKLQIYGNGGIHLMGGSVGVGTTSPSSSYKLDVSGVAHVTTGLLSDGYVTALSDVRLKKIIDRFTLKPEAIALASLIHYTWKKGHDDSVHVGGIAQEWQEILPEAVHDIDGRLTMDYGVIGMVSAVSLAKTVIEQEKRIKSLEERLAAIEAKLK